MEKKRYFFHVEYNVEKKRYFSMLIKSKNHFV